MSPREYTRIVVIAFVVTSVLAFIISITRP
jgi:hypothetical protein